MARTPKLDLTGIEDRWSAADRKGKGRRWRLRMRGLPGHEKPVVELFDDLDAAIVRRDELERAKKDPLHRIDAGRVSLAEVATAYVASLRTDPNPPTEGYMRTVAMVLQRAVDAGLDDLRMPGWAQAAISWIAQLRAKRHGQLTDAPASPSTQREYRAILGGALNYAVHTMGVLAHNPLRAIPARRTKARRMDVQSRLQERDRSKIIPIEALRRLVADAARWMDDVLRAAAIAAIERHKGSREQAARSLRVHVSTIHNRLARAERREDPRWILACLLTYTGMRIGQALALRWEDIDDTAQTIRLRADVVGNKSGIEAAIEIEPELREILAQRPRDGELVVPDPAEASGRLCKRTWLRDTFDAFLAKHGAKDHSAHDLRHSFVCLLTAMGIPTADVRRRVNHANIMMTSRYADHLIAAYRPLVANWKGSLRLRS